MTLAPAAPTAETTAGPTEATTAPPAADTTRALTAAAMGAGCTEAHAAPADQSVDLSASGRVVAPSLRSFNQYRLDLDLDLDHATITGTQTLVFTNRTGTALPDLLFHLYPNLSRGAPPAPGGITFGGHLDVGCVAVDGVARAPAFEDGGWLLRVPLVAPLPPGRSTSVTLHFVTVSPHDGGSNIWSAFNETKDEWALASAYPILATRVGDAWDTRRPNGWGDFVNSEMALYHVRAGLPAGQDLIATGTVVPTCSGSRCTATVTAGPQRDFALAVVHGWQQARKTVGDTVVVSSFPATARAGGERALALTADAVDRFDKAFGVYPYAELDVLAAPLNGNIAGVEYPGLIMIGNRYYDQSGASQMDLQDVVVHEAAHQWWYNVVGNDQLREPWLDEGLTSYTGEYLYTEWSGQGAKPVTEQRKASLERQHLDQTPIDGAVDAYPDDRAYVAVIYGRGPLFFDALRHELGDETFFKLLREYYRRYAFGVATTTSFEQLADDVAGRRLDTFFAGWLKQKAG